MQKVCDSDVDDFCGLMNQMLTIVDKNRVNDETAVKNYDYLLQKQPIHHCLITRKALFKRKNKLGSRYSFGFNTWPMRSVMNSGRTTKVEVTPKPRLRSILKRPTPDFGKSAIIYCGDYIFFLFLDNLNYNFWFVLASNLLNED